LIKPSIGSLKVFSRLDGCQVQRGACGVDSLHLVFLSCI
jgi:hypothetical protein